METISGYRVIRSGRRSVAIEIGEKGVVVRAPRSMARADIEAFVTAHRKWIETHLRAYQEKAKAAKEAGGETLTPEEVNDLKRRAASEIPPVVERYAREIGVDYGRITIKMQKTRWGSCSASGNLNFNCLLMLAPRRVIESVVVHELCHRRHMDHSKAFYRDVRAAFPDYDECSAWLKKYGPAIMAKRPE
ncbi:MAG: M48 family metallopeptidase [Anaerovoracaceae bacterium]|jgi:predicted metal-dependent hydrolase